MTSTDLNLDAGWRLGESSFAAIVDLARRQNARSILEFGSGASTVRLAQAIDDATIVSVEHDPGFYEQTLRLVQEHGLSDRVEVLRAPLGYWRFAGGLYYTYDLELPQRRFDLALIDGPPGYLITGRQACLHRCFDRLEVGAHVVLDDFEEPREQRTLLRWLAAYADAIDYRVVDTDHSLLVVEKKRECRPAAPGLGGRLRNAADNLRSAARRLKRRAGRLLK